eukprot:2582297-Pleurochrysis_carterae.AAC.1
MVGDARKVPLRERLVLLASQDLRLQINDDCITVGNLLLLRCHPLRGAELIGLYLGHLLVYRGISGESSGADTTANADRRASLASPCAALRSSVSRKKAGDSNSPCSAIWAEREELTIGMLLVSELIAWSKASKPSLRAGLQSSRAADGACRRTLLQRSSKVPSDGKVFEAPAEGVDVEGHEGLHVLRYSPLPDYTLKPESRVLVGVGLLDGNAELCLARVDLRSARGWVVSVSDSQVWWRTWRWVVSLAGGAPRFRLDNRLALGLTGQGIEGESQESEEILGDVCPGDAGVDGCWSKESFAKVT